MYNSQICTTSGNELWKRLVRRDVLIAHNPLPPGLFTMLIEEGKIDRKNFVGKDLKTSIRQFMEDVVGTLR